MLDFYIPLSNLSDGHFAVFLVLCGPLARWDTVGSGPEEVLSPVELDAREPGRKLRDGNRFIDDEGIFSLMDPVLGVPELGVEVAAFGAGPFV